MNYYHYYYGLTFGVVNAIQYTSAQDNILGQNEYFTWVNFNQFERNKLFFCPPGSPATGDEWVLPAGVCQRGGAPSMAENLLHWALLNAFSRWHIMTSPNITRQRTEAMLCRKQKKQDCKGSCGGCQYCTQLLKWSVPTDMRRKGVQTAGSYNEEEMMMMMKSSDLPCLLTRWTVVIEMHWVLRTVRKTLTLMCDNDNQVSVIHRGLECLLYHVSAPLGVLVLCCTPIGMFLLCLYLYSRVTNNDPDIFVY